MDIWAKLCCISNLLCIFLYIMCDMRRILYDYEHVIDSYQIFKFKFFENNATELILKAKSIKFYFKSICSKWNFEFVITNINHA